VEFTNSIPSSADAQGYLENLMRAGQDAMKQFEDALASATGVQTEESLSSGRRLVPFALIANLQHEYLRQIWRFWNAMFLQTFSGRSHADVALARGDKRFKDASWREQPYYDLLKQTYLLGSKQLHEFVDRAQVDAMSPSNFPATNPEVIRKAIETRSASLTDGMKNLIDDLQKGRITRVDESAFEARLSCRVVIGCTRSRPGSAPISIVLLANNATFLPAQLHSNFGSAAWDRNIPPRRNAEFR
jgi:polyhydroxyalkanoate synthase